MALSAMHTQNNIADQLHKACMLIFGLKPSKLSVLSFRVTEQYGALVTYAVLSKRIVRRQSKKNPGQYWQVTSNVLDFITLNSNMGEVFNSSCGLTFARNEVLRINKFIKDGVNPLDKMNVEKITKWSNREKESLLRVIWLDQA